MNISWISSSGTQYSLIRLSNGRDILPLLQVTSCPIDLRRFMGYLHEPDDDFESLGYQHLRDFLVTKATFYRRLDSSCLFLSPQAVRDLPLRNNGCGSQMHNAWRPFEDYPDNAFGQGGGHYFEYELDDFACHRAFRFFTKNYRRRLDRDWRSGTVIAWIGWYAPHPVSLIGTTTPFHLSCRHSFKSKGLHRLNQSLTESSLKTIICEFELRSRDNPYSFVLLEIAASFDQLPWTGKNKLISPHHVTEFIISLPPLFPLHTLSYSFNDFRLQLFLRSTGPLLDQPYTLHFKDRSLPAGILSRPVHLATVSRRCEPLRPSETQNCLPETNLCVNLENLGSSAGLLQYLNLAECPTVLEPAELQTSSHVSEQFESTGVEEASEYTEEEITAEIQAFTDEPMADPEGSEWTDLDVDDAGNDLMVSDYAVEILNYMKENESATMPNPSYMDDQEELTWEARGTMIDWLIKLQGHFHLLPETLFLGVNLVDRFLSARSVRFTKFKLVGLTCLYIAAKFEENRPPSPSEYLKHFHATYRELINAEKIILKTLHWNMSYPNPFNFLCRVSKADSYDVHVRTLAKYFLEIGCLEWTLISVTPSMMAAASIWLARLVLEKEVWTADLAHYSSYRDSDLVPVANLMLNYILKPVQHEAFHKKYETGKPYLKASIFMRRWVLKQWPQGTAIDLSKELPRIKAMIRLKRRDKGPAVHQAEVRAKRAFSEELDELPSTKRRR